MNIVVFPKFFRELDAAELGRTLKAIGFDGVDVMVRDGYWVTAETLTTSLPEFVRTMHDFGLSTETASTDYLDPADPDLEPAVACMAENGIRQFRLRHMRYNGLGTFHQDFDAAKRTLAHFEKLGERYGIRAVVQTHGGALHASAAATFFLVRDFDPAYIGVHHDPGNMICQEGFEAWDKSFDILGPYLSLVGVKNAGIFHVPSGSEYRLTWKRQWTTLEEGVVDWREILGLLKQIGFTGPLCMHNFYERGLEPLIAATRRDLLYLRSLLDELAI